MNLKLAPLALIAGALLSCGNDTDAPALTYGPLLETLGEQVILPEHQAFAAKADALVVALQALEDAPSAESLSGAQQAWRDARGAFRVLDALHIGPGITLGITDRIDVSPVDAAGIDAIVAATGAVDDAAVGQAGGKKKGFLGLEYLLFPAVGDSTATPPVLSGDDAAPRRRTLAHSMGDEIALSAHQLDDAWEPGTGGYVTQIETAGAGSTRYSSQRAAVDDLVGGVGYALELVVGIRLAFPLGRKTGGTPDPTLDFTARSDNSVADMQNSLNGVSALYSGSGFSSIVKGRSAKLDQTVLDELSDSQAKLTAIPAPFSVAITTDTSVVQAAYNATQALKTTWNTDVSSALGATLKPDNDGD
jgi:predicted lipoprotein